MEKSVNTINKQNKNDEISFSKTYSIHQQMNFNLAHTKEIIFLQRKKERKTQRKKKRIGKKKKKKSLRGKVRCCLRRYPYQPWLFHVKIGSGRYGVTKDIEE